MNLDLSYFDFIKKEDQEIKRKRDMYTGELNPVAPKQFDLLV